MCHFRLGMSAFLSIFKLIGIALTNVGTFFPEKRITSCIGQCDLNYFCRHRSRNPPPPPPREKKPRKEKRKEREKENMQSQEKIQRKILLPPTCAFFKIGSLWNVGIKRKEAERKESKRHKSRGSDSFRLKEISAFCSCLNYGCCSLASRAKASLVLD